MTDSKIEITPPSKRSSEDDALRKELMWEKREEVLLKKWMDELIIKKGKHHNIGKLNKKLYYLFGIPNIIIPLIIGSLNGVVDLSMMTLTILMISSSIFAGINTFMNFSKKTQLHFEFEAKYNELAVSIEKELSIPKVHRVAADVFLERVQRIYNSLNSYAPV